MSSPELLQAKLLADGLLARYVRCLDDGDLGAWPGFFTDPCIYRVTHRADDRAGYENALIFADSRGMLMDRVNAVENVSVYEPHGYRHIAGASLIEQVNGTLIDASTSFLVARIMQDGETSVFATGIYRDRIDISGDEPLFAEKVVVMDSERVDTLLAIPL